MDDVARAEAHLMKLSGDMLSRLDSMTTEAMCRATVAEASGDTAAALLWRDATEGLLPLLDLLALRSREGAASQR